MQINNMRTLHMWMSHSFDTDGLTLDMSETEIERCISLAHWTQYDMNIRLFSQIQFKLCNRYRLFKL